METEMKKLEIYPLRSITSWNPTATLAASDADALRYTSLRDVIPASSPGPATCWSGLDVHGLLLVGSSAISIRNRLVKHAGASAYVQSPAFLNSRNESCLVRLWARLTVGAARGYYYVRRPLSSCVNCVVWSVRRIMACLVGQVGRVWGGGGRTTTID